MKETAADQDIEFKVDLNEKIGDQFLDCTAIYLAILDLVSNAIDACAESELGHGSAFHLRLPATA